MFKNQVYHLLFLVLSLGILFRLPLNFSGNYLGVGSHAWFWLSIAGPIAHQVYVWLGWRLELHYQALSKVFGSFTFPLYVVGFFVLFVFRYAVLTGLALSNAGTFEIVAWAKYLMLGLFGIIVVVTFHSVVFYFGLIRAAGADHFIESYRKRGLVQKGVFRYVPNAMYTCAFLSFWMFGIGFESQLALVAAGFAHVYVWVHYYTTERPDMEILYGNGQQQPR